LNKDYNWLVSIRFVVTDDEKVERQVDSILKWTVDDVRRVKNAKELQDSTLWKITKDESYAIFNCAELLASFSAFQLRLKVNQAKGYLFYSEFDMTDEDLEMIIKYMPKKQLDQARVGI